jgi:hypothetical protein
LPNRTQRAPSRRCPPPPAIETIGGPDVAAARRHGDAGTPLRAVPERDIDRPVRLVVSNTAPPRKTCTASGAPVPVFEDFAVLAYQDGASVKVHVRDGSRSRRRLLDHRWLTVPPLKLAIASMFVRSASLMLPLI